MSNTETKDLQNKVFIVEHHATSDASAKNWWGEIAAKKPEEMEAMTQKANEAGFFNHLFVPTTVSTKVFCLWEIEAGKNVKDLQNLLNAEISLDAFIDVPLEVNAQANPALLPQLKAMNGKNEVVSSDSKFYMVEHHAKSDASAQKFFQKLASMKDEEWSAQKEKDNATGFNNHLFIPTINSCKIFCLWEISAGKSIKDLQDLLNTDYTKDDFTDVIMEINMQANPQLSKQLQPLF